MPGPVEEKKEKDEKEISFLFWDEKEQREILLTKLKEYQPKHEEYDDFREAMSGLDQDMEDLMKPGADGWQTVDAEKRSELIQKYEDAGAKLEGFLEKVKESKDPADVNAREICVQIGSLLSKDMDTLRKYDPSKEERSLPTLLEDARVKVVGTDADSYDTVGGANSSRKPFVMIADDGKKVPGFFTEKKIFEPVKEVNEICEWAARSAKTEDGKQWMRDFFKNYRDYYTNNPDPDHPVDGDNKTTQSFMLGMQEDATTTKSKILRDKVVNTLATVTGKTAREIRQNCGKNSIDLLMLGMQKIKTSHAMHYGMDMPENARIDSRNSAMSSVAELIGASGLVCRANPMKMKTKNGEVVEGTFMEEAKGVDPNYPESKYMAVGRSDPFRGTNGQIFRQLADLQVLDYICGNIDRHSANMFYQFDDHYKLIGVQGIDNDASFGKNTGLNPDKGTVKRIGMMAPPTSMGVMSKEMADRVMALKKEDLAFTLRGQMEESAIDAAWKRVDIMQQIITISRQKLSKGQKTVEFPYIRELSGDDWKNMKIETLAGKNNIFKEANAGVILISVRAERGHQISAVDNLVGNDNRATQGGMYDQQKRAANLNTLLDKRTSSRRTSPNYIALQTAMKEYLELTKKLNRRMENSRKMAAGETATPEVIFGQYMSRSDMSAMTEAAKKLKEAADKYLTDKRKELKDNNKKPKDYTKDRMDGAHQVSLFAGQLLEMTQEEKTALQKNSRRATEEVARRQKEGTLRENVTEIRKAKPRPKPAHENKARRMGK